MRLVVDAPSDWGGEALPEGRHIVCAPGFRDKPDLVIVTFPLVSVPDPASELVDAFVRRDVSPGSTVRVRSTSDTLTTLGAPLHLVEAEVANAVGVLVEQRIAAFVQLSVFTGRMMVRAKPPGRFAAHRDVLLAVLRSARADFSGQIAALAQLTEGMMFAAGDGDRWEVS